MAFAPGELLAPVIPVRAAALSRLDRLAVEDGGARVGRLPACWRTRSFKTVWMCSQMALLFISMGQPGCSGVASCWSGLQVGIGGSVHLYRSRVLSKS